MCNAIKSDLLYFMCKLNIKYKYKYSSYHHMISNNINYLFKFFVVLKGT